MSWFLKLVAPSLGALMRSQDNITTFPMFDTAPTG